MPLQHYRALIQRGELRLDLEQEAAADRLDRLARALEATTSAPVGNGGGLLARLGLGRTPPPPPRGVYLHGGVGRGKSMLMDLFAAAVQEVSLRRVHFHAFMLEVQRRLHRLRDAGERADPLQILAAELAGEHRVLCFDEFHVVNIADAMILGRLFEGLFARGTVMVATSNWPPDRLYENGLNRDRFLPFIDLLKARLDIVALDGPTDYRLARLRDLAVYHHPLGPAAEAALDAAFAAITEGATPTAVELAVGTRVLRVPRAAAGAARFDFADLCNRPLGAADYLALAAQFHSLFLDGVPVLAPNRRNEARRFMTLVDALYECRMMLFVSAEAPADELYPAGDGTFEFQRTVSRLLEMQSRTWLAACRQRRPEELPRSFAPFALTSDLS